MGGMRYLAIACLMLVACGDAVFQCSEDEACDAGTCEASGYCSFEDATCDSGRRYGALAGGGLADVCVPVEDGSTGSSTTTFTSTSTTTSTSTSTSTGDPVTTTPVGSSDGSGSTGIGSHTQDSGPSESEATTAALEVTVWFGDRSDADFQGVTADASLLNYATADNMGGHADVHVDGNDFGAWQVGLVRFDVSALPSDVTVIAAELHLWSYESVSPGDIDIHAVTESWVEGDGDQVPGVCNWLEREIGTPWTTEGAGEGAYDPRVLATFEFDEAWAEYAITLPTGVIEAWRDEPENNFGLLFRSIGLMNPIYFASHEEPEESLRPLLVVTYSG